MKAGQKYPGYAPDYQAVKKRTRSIQETYVAAAPALIQIKDRPRTRDARKLNALHDADVAFRAIAERVQSGLVAG
jgi:hypothetical protein